MKSIEKTARAITLRQDAIKLYLHGVLKSDKDFNDSMKGNFNFAII